MGTEPLTGSAGGGGCTKSRSRRCTQEDFTQLRAAKMRKTLLQLGGLYCVLARERAVLQYTRAAGEVERKDWSPPLLRAHGASFYMLKGLPTGGSVGEGKNGRMLYWVQLPAQWLYSAIIPNSDGGGQGH